MSCCRHYGKGEATDGSGFCEKCKSEINKELEILKDYREIDPLGKVYTVREELQLLYNRNLLEHNGARLMMPKIAKTIELLDEFAKKLNEHHIYYGVKGKNGK